MFFINTQIPYDSTWT